MIDRRSRLVEIFNDTSSYINETDSLLEAVEYSKKNTKFYPSDKYFDIANNQTHSPYIEVNEYKSFECAMKLAKENPNKRIAVLNFASATSPGGGVRSGSSAQEESLCRCSTLYPCLTTKYLFAVYYGPNRDHGTPIHTDDIIYTPNIKIIKSDDDYPSRLLEKDFVDVDIITCAAPNLRERPNNHFNYENDVLIGMNDEKLFDIHLSRARHILNIAIHHHVDILVLGAFGCGAFRNNPYVVAKAYKKALEENGKYFYKVVFPIYHREYEAENYLAFKEVL